MSGLTNVLGSKSPRSRLTSGDGGRNISALMDEFFITHTCCDHCSTCDSNIMVSMSTTIPAAVVLGFAWMTTTTLMSIPGRPWTTHAAGPRHTGRSGFATFGRCHLRLYKLPPRRSAAVVRRQSYSTVVFTVVFRARMTVLRNPAGIVRLGPIVRDQQEPAKRPGRHDLRMRKSAYDRSL